MEGRGEREPLPAAGGRGEEGEREGGGRQWGGAPGRGGAGFSRLPRGDSREASHSGADTSRGAAGPKGDPGNERLVGWRAHQWREEWAAPCGVRTLGSGDRGRRVSKLGRVEARAAGDLPGPASLTPPKFPLPVPHGLCLEQETSLHHASCRRPTPLPSPRPLSPFSWVSGHPGSHPSASHVSCRFCRMR